MSLTKVDRMVMYRMIKKSMEWFVGNDGVNYAYPSKLFWGCWPYIKSLTYMVESELKIKQIDIIGENKIKRKEWIVCDNKQHPYVKYKKMIQDKKRISGAEYIYIMYSEQLGRFKIGISISPEERKNALKTGVPDIQLLAYWEVIGKHNPKHIEKTLHDMYSGVNCGGEWFLLPEIVDDIFDDKEQHNFDFIKNERKEVMSVEAVICDIDLFVTKERFAKLSFSFFNIGDYMELLRMANSPARLVISCSCTP